MDTIIQRNHSVNCLKTQVKIGLEAPVRVLHVSDTHLTYADLRDGERKVKLAADRSQYFCKAEQILQFACDTAKELQIPIVHTGDLIDFVSKANLEAAKRFTNENDCFMATGNHEFSLYVGEAWEDADYRNQSLAAVQASFQNDIRMSSRIIGGLNFVALDNGYYLFDPEHLEFLKQEVKKGLPIVLMFHTPLYDRALYDYAMEKNPTCAYLADVPEALMECYDSHRFRQQRADAITHETVEYIRSQPLIKSILTGHLHFNYEGMFGDRIAQIVTACEDVRLVEFI